MTGVAQFIDDSTVRVVMVERIEPITFSKPRYRVRAEGSDPRKPIVIEFETDKRPDVEARCYVALTIYEETP